MQFHPSLVLPAATLLAAATSAQELLWEQDVGLYPDDVASLFGGDVYKEAADDFDLVAEITRVRIFGTCGFPPPPGDLASIRVRFYDWTEAGPGGLQHEAHLQAGDPGLSWVAGPKTIDVTLPASFFATGKHFLSAQVELEPGGYWVWLTANTGAHVGQPIHYRESPTEAWTTEIPGFFAPPAGEADLGFELWGSDGTPFTGGTDPCGPYAVVPAPVDEAQDVLLQGVDGVAPDDVWAVGRKKVQKPGSVTESQVRGVALHWDGASWSEVAVPFPEPYPGGGHVTLYAVRAIASDDVWAAGTFDTIGPDGFGGFQIFTIHWDGAGWTQVAAPMTSGASGSSVYGIDALSSDDVWFTGEWVDASSGLGLGRSLAMHWDGAGFTLHDTPVLDVAGGGFADAQGLRAVAMLATDDVWAVGGGSDGDPTPHSNILHWDGAQWTHVPGPTPLELNELLAVEAVAPDDVWAAGFQFYPQQPFFLHWDGAAWTEVPSPGGGEALLARASNDVLSVGGLFGGDGVVRWNGSSWQEVVSFAGVVPDPDLRALGAPVGVGQLAGCEVWAVGRSNSTLPSGHALTVHLDPSAGASAAVREPCVGEAVPGGLAAGGPPVLGATFEVALDDPTGAAGLSAGSLALWAVTSSPGPKHPCGLVLPGFGPGGAAGEILIDPTFASLVLASPPVAWSGPGSPALVGVPVPADAALKGLKLYSQGLFLDPGRGEVALTNALDLLLGS